MTISHGQHFASPVLLACAPCCTHQQLRNYVLRVLLLGFSCINKSASIQVVYHLCQQVLASKPTTLEEDIASLQQAQDLEVRDAHHILALQFRIGKKELLQSCLWQYDPQQL